MFLTYTLILKLFLFETGDALQGIVFVRLQLNCGMPIEFTYYSSSAITRKDLCCHCATEGIERDQEVLKQYKVVLPVCELCKSAGKGIPKRGPLKK